MPLAALTYRLPADYVSRSQPHRDAHVAHVMAAAATGAMAVAGAIGMPPESALYVFADEAAARRFAETDPYVTAGVAVGWAVAPWFAIVGPGAPAA